MCKFLTWLFVTGRVIAEALKQSHNIYRRIMYLIENTKSKSNLTNEYSITYVDCFCVFFGIALDVGFISKEKQNNKIKQENIKILTHIVQTRC